MQHRYQRAIQAQHETTDKQRWGDDGVPPNQPKASDGYHAQLRRVHDAPPAAPTTTQEATR